MTDKKDPNQTPNPKSEERTLKRLKELAAEPPRKPEPSRSDLIERLRQNIRHDRAHQSV